MTRFVLKNIILACLMLMLLAGPASAQITKTSRAEIDTATKKIALGPYIYMTADPQKRLTYQTIVNRHQNNQRGAKQDYKLINLSSTLPSAWMVFSVTNNSNQENWILHFGNVLDGRQALAYKLLVRNDTTGEIFTKSLRAKNQPHAFGEDLLGAALPIKVRAGQTDLFVTYIEGTGGLPSTISPQIMSQKYFYQSAANGNLQTLAFNSFLILCIGFFAAIVLLKFDPNYLLFSLYYILNAILFNVLNAHFFADFTFQGQTIAALVSVCILCGLWLTRNFLEIYPEDQRENTLLFYGLTSLAGCVILNMALFDETSTIGDILVFLPPIITCAILSVVCFLWAQRHQYTGHYMSCAWLCVFFGLSLWGLSALEIIPTRSLWMNAYWLFLIPQAFIFMLATKKKIEISEEEQRHQQSRQNRAAASLARLQQSKETADQARLLRVIDRERELMTELREREMQRAEEMRRAKEMADEANRSKSAFLAVVSHEIRTPMTGILGMVKLLMKTKLSKEQMDYSHAIQKSGDTMMALLNDILDFEKIETGSMSLERIEFDFPRLVHDVIMLMSGHATDKKIDLKSEISANFPAHLLGDPTRLRQVILNLASNAIKFTERGQVVIKLQAVKLLEKPHGIKGDFEITVSVEDTGIGIPQKALEDLFSPFKQADESVSRRYGGTGLGLAICKRLIEAMGSTIHVESKEGEGSRFFFSLLMEQSDYYQKEQATQNNENASSILLPNMKILIVEDNEINRKVLEGFLRHAGQTSILCESGEQALEILKEQTDFSAIFVDINLSGMSGIKTSMAIRAWEDHKISHIPIIAITGNVADSDIEHYMRSGLNDFIAKPLDPEKLHTVLEKIAAQAYQAENAQRFYTPEKPSILQESQKTQTEPAPIILKTNLSFEDDDNEFDSFESAIEQEKTSSVKTNTHNDVCDYNMLESLRDSLGMEEFQNLMAGFFDKSDEIVHVLAQLRQSSEAPSVIQNIKDRAHELKGMAANFGMKALSRCALDIESALKAQNIPEALRRIDELPAYNQEAKEAMDSWLNQ